VQKINQEASGLDLEGLKSSLSGTFGPVTALRPELRVPVVMPQVRVLAAGRRQVEVQVRAAQHVGGRAVIGIRVQDRLPVADKTT
jgi:hypothetical protein